MGEGKGEGKDPVVTRTECSESDCNNVMPCYGSKRCYHCGNLGKGHGISLCIIFTIACDPTVI